MPYIVEAERDRMGDGEGRDLDQDRPQLHAQQEQPEDEQDVIEALGQDVRVAERQVLARRPRGASPGGTAR